MKTRIEIIRTIKELRNKVKEEAGRRGGPFSYYSSKYHQVQILEALLDRINETVHEKLFSFCELAAEDNPVTETYHIYPDEDVTGNDVGYKCDLGDNGSFSIVMGCSTSELTYTDNSDLHDEFPKLSESKALEILTS